MNYKILSARLVLFIVICSFMLAAGYNQNEESESQSKVESVTRTYSAYKPKTDYRVDVTLNQIDLIALDKDGNHITNLKPDEFTLIHDGRKQKIIKVDKVGSVEKLKLIADRSRKSTEGKIRYDVINDSGGNYYGFLVANLPKYVNKKKTIFDTIKKFIQIETDMGDRIALYHMSQFSIKQVQPFITDTKTIMQNILAYMNSELFRKNQFQYVNPYIAGEEFWALESQDMANLEKEMEAGTGIKPREFSETVAMTRKSEQNNVFLRVMKNIKLLAAVLRNYPGRKNIVLITEGLYSWVETGHPMEQAGGREIKSTYYSRTIKDAISGLHEEFNAYNISLYVLDVGRKPGVNVFQNVHESEKWGQDIAFNVEEARVGALRGIAVETGGSFFEGTGGSMDALAKALNRIKYESSFYYNISYVPDIQQMPGDYYPVEVEVERDDIELKYRSGISYPKNYQQMNGSEREAYVTESIISGIDYNDISLFSDVRFFPGKDKNVLSLFSLEVSLGDILQERERDSFVSLLCSCLVLTKQGEVFKEFHKNVRVDMKNEFREGGRERLRYLQFLLLPPGEYKARFMVTDRVTGKRVSQDLPLEVPDYSRAEIALGSILEAADNSKVFAVHDYAPLPGREEISLDKENPLYLNGNIFVHSFSNKDTVKNIRKIFLLLRGISREVVFKKAMKWNIVKQNREYPDEDERKSIPYQIEQCVEHKNGTVGLLVQISPGLLLSGDYSLEGSFLDEQGIMHKTVHYFRVGDGHSTQKTNNSMEE